MLARGDRKKASTATAATAAGRILLALLVVLLPSDCTPHATFKERHFQQMQVKRERLLQQRKMEADEWEEDIWDSPASLATNHSSGQRLAGLTGQKGSEELYLPDPSHLALRFEG